MRKKKNEKENGLIEGYVYKLGKLVYYNWVIHLD
jgi:hypothetical protein